MTWYWHNQEPKMAVFQKKNSVRHLIVHNFLQDRGWKSPANTYHHNEKVILYSNAENFWHDPYLKVKYQKATTNKTVDCFLLNAIISNTS